MAKCKAMKVEIWPKKCNEVDQNISERERVQDPIAVISKHARNLKMAAK